MNDVGNVEYRVIWRRQGKPLQKKFCWYREEVAQKRFRTIRDTFRPDLPPLVSGPTIQTRQVTGWQTS